MDANTHGVRAPSRPPSAVFRPYNEQTGETIPNAYVYTYMYYYPWNGCSNQALGTQVLGGTEGGRREGGRQCLMCGWAAGDVGRIIRVGWGLGALVSLVLPFAVPRRGPGVRDRAGSPP